MNTARSITVWIASSECFSEKKLGNDLSIAQLSDRLEIITGIPVANQLIKLQSTKNTTGHGGDGEGEGEVVVLSVLSHLNQSLTLDQCGVRDWMTIRVDSTDPNAKSTVGQYTDTTRVEKFDITKEDYEARSDTVRSYKQFHKLGRFAPSPASSPVPSPLPLSSSFILGARCQVALSEEFYRRGAVRFIGRTSFGTASEEIWIGVEFDEPVGKGDGSVEGQRYFQTLPLRASFFRPDKVEVGDYEELDPFAELDDEDEEM